MGGRKTQRKKKAVPRQSRRRKYSHQKQQVFRSGQTKSPERFESKIVGRTLSLPKKGEETGQTQTRAARCQRTKSKTHNTAPSIALSLPPDRKCRRKYKLRRPLLALSQQLDSLKRGRGRRLLRVEDGEELGRPI